MTLGESLAHWLCGKKMVGIMRVISLYWETISIRKRWEDKGGKTKGLSLFGGCVGGRPLHTSTWFLYFLDGWSERENLRKGAPNGVRRWNRG